MDLCSHALTDYANKRGTRRTSTSSPSTIRRTGSTLLPPSVVGGDSHADNILPRRPQFVKQKSDRGKARCHEYSCQVISFTVITLHFTVSCIFRTGHRSPRYIGVNQQTKTNLDNLEENIIDDCGSADGNGTLSEDCIGFARFQILKTRPPEGRTWVNGREPKPSKHPGWIQCGQNRGPPCLRKRRRQQATLGRRKTKGLLHRHRSGHERETRKTNRFFNAIYCKRRSNPLPRRREATTRGRTTKVLH